MSDSEDPERSEDQPYVNIREHLGHFIGQRVADITQHDEEEWKQTGQAYIMLMFENGKTIKFPVGDEPVMADPDE